MAISLVRSAVETATGRGDEEEQTMNSTPSMDQALEASQRRRSIRCIVKLGGAAITCKNELESINEANLRTVCAQLRETMLSPESVVGMDWSRRPGNAFASATADEFREISSLDLLNNFIIVHGAGSFGHFQASTSGVHRGGLHLPLVKAGFVATRISVTLLNLEIVRALANEGIPSVGMSPFSCGWSTSGRNMTTTEVSQVINAVDAGFVPVLHGDAVLDDLQDCNILSGDVIIRHLAQLLRPDYVVFLTDVLGVYDRPPTDPNAILLREIAVAEDGSWSIVKPNLQHDKNAVAVEITVAAHDTTGGMETKISEAAAIAKLGINVFITKAGTEHSLKALNGDVHGDDWLGTVIRSKYRQH